MSIISIVVIGGGVSGLVAAINLKNKLPDKEIILIEKNSVLGGRLYSEDIIINNDKYKIDYGPSWCWMPKIIKKVLKELDINIKNLKFERLDPQYKIIYYDKKEFEVPGTLEKIEKLILRQDINSFNKFTKFMSSNRKKYKLMLDKIFYFRNLDIYEYIDLSILRNISNFKIFSGYKDYCGGVFSKKILKDMMCWSGLFIGNRIENLNGIFSILTYSMLKEGTYLLKRGNMEGNKEIKGSQESEGMYELIKELECKAFELGIKVVKNTEVIYFDLLNNKIKGIQTRTENEFGEFNNKNIQCDKVVSACDYYYTESLLSKDLRTYREDYWRNLKICPSSLTFHIILKDRLPNLLYHNLIFNNDFDKYIEKYINTDKLKIPKKPLFYINIKDYENEKYKGQTLFILTPTNPKIILTDHYIESIYKNIIIFLQEYTDDYLESRKSKSINILNNILYKTHFSNKDYKTRYLSFFYNSYGISCENNQFGLLRPKIKSDKVENLYYCGQMTNPGPGIPPCMISGLNTSNLLVEDLLNDKMKENRNNKYILLYNYFNNIIDIFESLIIMIVNFIIFILTMEFNFY